MTDGNGCFVAPSQRRIKPPRAPTGQELSVGPIKLVHESRRSSAEVSSCPCAKSPTVAELVRKCHLGNRGFSSRRVTTWTAVMISIRSQFMAVTLCALATACARTTRAPSPVVPPIASRPDVIVTFDGERHACVVALFDEATGHAMSCEGVLPFIGDDLKLQADRFTTFVRFPTLTKRKCAVSRQV
jgi:hypothetical protein